MAGDEEQAKLLLEIIPLTMRTIRGEMRREAGADLTVPQFRVLGRLSRQVSSNSELAEWMGVSAPTMSNIVDKLVGRGLVAREEKDSDRRQVVLSCTKKGASRAQLIRLSVQKIFTKRIKTLSLEKQQALAEGLLVLKDLFL